ncbi:ABC transporter permease [Euzebya sp.]|uniref:ABC transporter permease n=1 Tax=Euzebya sp. TaxID=1971409 RepID=UPI0035134D48
MSTATVDSPARAVEATRVVPARTRLVVIGWIYTILGVGFLDLARRVPEDDVTFNFGVPPGVPQITLDPGGAVLLIGLVLVVAGITGILEHRLGRVTSVALAVATALFIPLILILSLAYSTSSKTTNAIPIVVESLRQATPIALGALGGLWCERSGVVNIGIEGMMLAGAGGGFVAYAVLGGAAGGGWLWVAVLIAVLIGGLMAALHAVLCITFRTDQIISGVVLNLLALGLTSYLRTQVLVPLGAGNGITLPRWELPLLSDLPIVGPLFEGQPIYFSMFVLLAVTTFVLGRTRFGLRVRSVGENPHAAETLGIDPIRIRYAAVIIGGLIAGLGGAWFSLETVGSFEDNMTNGTGFIALAALIFGKWRPWPAFGGALLFGFASALETRLQILSVRLDDFSFLAVPVPDLTIPSQFLQALPFVVTIIVLAGAIGRAVAPAADGEPFEPSR